jgi:hypothetical protein
MAELPLRANQKSYLGNDRHRRSQVQLRNQRAQKIVDYINALIANNPLPQQPYISMSIAYDFGCDNQDVREAVGYGGGSRSVSLKMIAREWRITRRKPTKNRH